MTRLSIVLFLMITSVSFNTGAQDLDQFAKSTKERFSLLIQPFDATGVPSQTILHSKGNGYESFTVYNRRVRDGYIEVSNRWVAVYDNGGSENGVWNEGWSCVNFGRFPENFLQSCPSNPVYGADVSQGGFGKPGSYFGISTPKGGTQRVEIKGVRDSVPGLEWVPGEIIEIESRFSGAGGTFTTTTAYASKTLGGDVVGYLDAGTEVVGLTVGGKQYGQNEDSVRHYVEGLVRQAAAARRRSLAESRRQMEESRLQIGSMIQALQALRSTTVSGSPGISSPSLSGGGAASPTGGVRNCRSGEEVCPRDDAACLAKLQAIPACKR